MAKNSSKMSLSLCMIVKDEEKNLSQCLESVKGIVDKIIVVDTGSTDSTIEIAESYGAEVYTFPWVNDFSAARNFSLEKANSDWIVALDADESISPENGEKLLNLITKTDRTAFYLNFRNKLQNSAVGSEMISSHPRLFRNGLGIKFSGKIHEQIIESVESIGQQIAYTDIIVDHFGYTEEAMHQKEKIKRNNKILLEDLRENPNKSITLFHLGENYSLGEDWEKAIASYEKAAANNDLPDKNMSILYQNLGTAYLHNKNSAQAAKMERLSLKLQKERITPHVVLAEIAMSEGNYDLAIWEWKHVLKKIGHLEEGAFDKLSEHIVDTSYVQLRIGQSYFQSKDFSAALQSFSMVPAHSNDYISAQVWLAKSHLTMGNITEAEVIFEQIKNGESGHRIQIMTLEGSLRVAENRLHDGAAIFEKILSLDPENLEARRALGNLYAALGDADRASEYLEKDNFANSGTDSGKKIAESFLKQGKAEEAKKALSLYIENKSNDYEVYFLYAFAADVSGDFNTAVSFCDKSINLNREDVRVFYLKGGCLVKLNRYDEAAASFRDAIQINADMPDAWMGLGIASVRLQDFQSAKDSFERVVRLRPDDYQAKKNLAAVCGKLGLHEEAEKYLLMTKTP